MIVVEGPDNAGKSTLSSEIGLQRFSAGPAPRDSLELRECLRDQKARASVPCIQDRLTCISQQVYSDAPESSILQRDLDELIEKPMFVVVYCRPPERVLMDFSTHKVKSYDTEKSLEKITDNQHTYIERYDELMRSIPHVLYDWTEYRDHGSADLNRFVRMLVNTQYSVDEWKRIVSMCKDFKVTAY